MEGKEVRFGIAQSALWATATTAASNGSVNSMHDSYTPLGGLVPMWLMQLGEVVFGGVGSGLYGMLAFAIIAVFIGGLMVGRTPEYLGKKIESFEMKMAAIIILIPPMAVLVGTAIAVCFPDLIKPSIPNSGAHGFSEVLYAFSLGQQQQRQRVCRTERQRAVLRHAARAVHAGGPLLPEDSDSGDCRLAGRQEVHADQRRHVAHARAAVCRACWLASSSWSVR